MLDGGAENDLLNGGSGSDVYKFGRGSGQDTIINYDLMPGKLDTIQLGADILPGNITLTSFGDDLIVSINGGADRLSVSNYLYNSPIDGGGYYCIEQIQFADGTVWTQSDIASRLVSLTPPQAVNDGFEAVEDVPLVLAANDLLANDYDADGDTLSIVDVANAQHGSVSFDINTGSITFIPDADYSGAAQFGYTVSDGHSTGQGLAYVVVEGTNDSPTLNQAQSDIAIAENSEFTYVIPVTAFSDIDVGDVLSYSVSLASGSPLPQWLVFDSLTRTLSGTPGSADVGSLDVRITATDLGEAFVSDIITLTINPATNEAVSQTLIGSNANDVLQGGAGDDTLDGGAGNDRLIGGDGDDAYIVGAAGDVVVELANEGIDEVRSSVTTTLGANVERLTLVGSTGIRGSGNELDNVLIGNSGNNSLNGAAGSDTVIGAEGNDILNGDTGFDTLIGGAGNDIYIVDNLNDVVLEDINAGTDRVDSSVDWILSDNVENLILTGTAAVSGTGNALNNSLTGNSATNTLYGGEGNDLINGGADADTLVGGAGNDTYTVDNINDVVVEDIGVGMDRVNSSVDWTLGDNIENLTLTGSSTINGTGNALNNAITGNAAANTLIGHEGNDALNGSAGADTLIGGVGNDTYTVDNIADEAIEDVGAGTDRVNSSIDWTLGDNIENLTLTGSAAINGTGNALNNAITGNAAANILIGHEGNDALNGGAGADTLIGGTGNDTYTVDNIADEAIEDVGAGTDRVNSSVDWTLANHIENLTLSGSASINGTGNALVNVITGNAGANQLRGMAGNDSLYGGLGNDTYVFGRGDGVDRIVENDSTAGNTDVLSFLAGVEVDQLWFRHVGNNLEVSIIGTSDKAIIANWYTGTASHIEQFKTADGQILLDSQVESLVSAMAAFAPPGTGQTTLPQNYQDQLGVVIAANWQ